MRCSRPIEGRGEDQSRARRRGLDVRMMIKVVVLLVLGMGLYLAIGVVLSGVMSIPVVTASNFSIKETPSPIGSMAKAAASSDGLGHGPKSKPRPHKRLPVERSTSIEQKRAWAASMKIHVYDWPGESYSRVGEMNWGQTSLFNHGYGPVLSAEHGLHHTNQYSLYKIVLHRVLTDPRRTLHPRNAGLFFIPYDLGHDAAMRAGGPNVWPNHCRDAAGIAERLNQSVFFRRSNGRDHVLVVSINFGMNFYMHEVCMKFLSGICQECIKISIDDYSFLFGGKFDHMKGQSMEVLKQSRGVNWRAVPFPSDVHWHRGMVHPYPWASRHTRRFLVAYGGSTASYYRRSEKIRGALARQCDDRPALCVRKSYGAGRAFDALDHDNGTSIHTILNQSVFCLNPPGDLPTRKGLFDAILLGCIPVTFNPLTASVMYTWNWNESLWKSVIVELKHDDVVKRHFNIVDYLSNLVANDPNFVSKRQTLISDHASRLQYSMAESPVLPPPPRNPNTTSEAEFAAAEAAFVAAQGPPDAYTVVMQGIVDTIAGLHSGLREGSIPDCGFQC